MIATGVKVDAEADGEGFVPLELLHRSVQNNFLKTNGLPSTYKSAICNLQMACTVHASQNYH